LSASGLPARLAALSVLSDVLRRRRPLDAALEQHLSSAQLDSRDAGFARAIASETLRRFGQLDRLIAHFVPKPPAPHKAGPTLEILLAGACELVFLDVPAHAAVDAANRLAQRDAKAVHFRPLVNAVLRRVAAEGKSIAAGQDAGRLNTPDWLWARWCQTYDEATARAIATAHLVPPPLDLSVKAGAQAWADKLQARLLPNNVLRLAECERVDSLPGYDDGAWWVQDFAASLPARLLGDVRGKSVIDLCAAPGGKTMQLAAAGANVTAVERAPERLARLKQNLARTKLSAVMIESDLRDFSPPEAADFVLLDAPCTATGTIRRHPDLPWLKSAADVTLGAQAASELLDHAAGLVAPGGLLVFAVCSLEREEGIEQVEAFLARHPQFAREKVSPDDVSGMDVLISPQGDLRTLPCHLAALGGMDGFYAAKLRRGSG